MSDHSFRFLCDRLRLHKIVTALIVTFTAAGIGGGYLIARLATPVSGQVRHLPSITPATPIKTPIKGIGLSVPTFPSLPSDTQVAWLKKFKSLGITWLRFDIRWQIVQPESAATYDWSEYDTAIANADAYGMNVDAIVDFSAPWSGVRGCPVSGIIPCEPASAQAYATYAAAIARHYGSKIASEEIWNEPNDTRFWWPAPNPAFYVSMLKDSYTAIKAVDPIMIVVSGGLAVERDKARDISSVTFVRDMYDDGAKGYFDALGDHPYSYPALPDQYERWSGWSQLAETSPSIRSVMAANGDSSTPIWMTEVGAPTGGPLGAATCTSTSLAGDDYDNQCRQAQEMKQLVQNERALPWVGPLMIYTYEDRRTQGNDRENFYGILSATGIPKMSYAALKDAMGDGR